MMTKKTWETPELEVFGSMQALTAQGEPPNAKFAGTHDGAPHQDCPPGQVKMGAGFCGLAGTS